jgi:biopolymer transport protein ExbB
MSQSLDPQANAARWSWRWIMVALVAVVALHFGAVALHAAPADASAAKPVAAMGQGMPTPIDLFFINPWINGAILALSVISLLLFVFLMLTLSGSLFNPPRFINDVTRLILNRQFDPAIHLCQSHSGVFVSSVVQRVVENREKELSVLMSIIDAEGRRRAEIVWSRVGYLAEIANIAPLFGLLGTVLGMIRVFFTLNTRVVSETRVELSSGIAEAMGATMFGLIVAIGAGIFYTMTRARAVRALAEGEQVCHTLADQVHRVAGGAAARGAVAPVTARTPFE